MKKIIHYFYDDINIWQRTTAPSFKICMASWLMHCQDYEIKLWHTGMPEFQEILEKSRFVRECLKRKMWAFIADYIRHYALFNYGGIYLDTDVQLLKNFDKFLDKPFFCSIEGDIYHGSNILESAVLGGEKGHIVFKEMLDIYDSDEIFKYNYLIEPIVLTEYLHQKIGFEKISYTTEKHSQKAKEFYTKEDYHNLTDFELYTNQTIYKNEEFKIYIYPSEYFCPNWRAFADKAFTDKTIAIHWNQSSWGDMNSFNVRRLESFRYKNILKQGWYLIVPKIAKIISLAIRDKTTRKNFRKNLIKKLG